MKSAADWQRELCRPRWEGTLHLKGGALAGIVTCGSLVKVIRGTVERIMRSYMICDFNHSIQPLSKCFQEMRMKLAWILTGRLEFGGQ